MDRRRGRTGYRRNGRGNRNKYTDRDNSEPGSSHQENRPGGTKRYPPHLRGKGKEIGLFYANMQKKREREFAHRPIGTVLLSEIRKTEIKTLLNVINVKKEPSIVQENDSYSHIQDSAFKNEFLKIITGSIEERLNDSTAKKSLNRNEHLDIKYYENLNDKLKSQEYKQFLPIREKLPSFKKRNEIINLVNNNQVIVISGETGCGKTTQVGQFILDDYILSKNGSICKIICTQPRRISAISVAERVAQERGENCGFDTVGYQIRLEKKLPRSTGSIVFCTTGVLLKQMESDPYLSDISHLILDEIHERDVVSDFIITLVKQLITKRSDLKLILMSATLNAAQFCSYFNDCKSIEIPGFTFPVTCYYLEDVLSKVDFEYPPCTEIVGWKKHLKYNKLKSKSEAEFRDFVEPYVRNLRAQNKYSKRVCDALANPKSELLNIDLIFELLRYICNYEPDGSILVFLPGFADISKLNSLMINSNCFPEFKFLIILLHSKMPSIQQRQVFDRPPRGVRKIVIATNIAETSITIDDIIYVIDCGMIKMKSYDVENDIEALKPEWVSLANANQRKGRAGRVQPGVCYHLFTKVRQNCLESYQQPEIQRSRLENIILSVKILQLGKTETFLNKLMDPPQAQAVENALQLLKHMNALDAEERLTPLGYHLAKLPLNPRMGKMILLGSLFSCLDPIASIAASLDFKDAFYTPVDKQKEVDNKKREILSGWKSDHLILAEALRQYEIAKSERKEKQFCWNFFLSSHTFDLLINMKKQFADYLCDMKFLTNNNIKSKEWNQNSENLCLIKAIVCASLYPNVALIRKVNRMRKVIKTTEDERVQLHPSSVNATEDVFDSPILVYHLKLKSSSIFLHDTSMVHPLSLLFFGDGVKIDEMSDGNTVISLSNVLRFKTALDTALLIKQLRKHLDDLLQYKISHPGIVNWMENSTEVSVLRAIMELITSEDIGELEDEDEDYRSDN